MSFSVNEQSSATYTATLVDAAGVAVSGAVLQTLTLTLYDVPSLTVINGRNAQNVLNLNDVTVDTSGLLTWNLRALDNVIHNAAKQIEHHVALFMATWTDTGGKPQELTHEVVILVANLQKVA